jgi:hypothetical protein
MNYGFIYCLGNETMPGIYKIGMTERAPSQRCFELSSSTSAAMPFSLLCFGEVDNAKIVERELHDHFAGYRVNKAREFFRVHYRNIHDVFGEYACPVVETADAAELAHNLSLMDDFYSAATDAARALALLEALRASGVRVWRDGESLKTSSRLPYNSWMTGAVLGLRSSLMQIVPTKEPVTHLMTLVRSLEKSE